MLSFQVFNLCPWHEYDLTWTLQMLLFWNSCPYSGKFTVKSCENVPVSFTMSVSPNVITQELLTEFSWCLILGVLIKFARLFQFWLKSGDNRYFTWWPTCVSEHVSNVTGAWLTKYLSERKLFLKSRERWNVFYILYIFPSCHYVFKIITKNVRACAIIVALCMYFFVFVSRKVKLPSAPNT